MDEKPVIPTQPRQLSFVVGALAPVWRIEVRTTNPKRASLRPLLLAALVLALALLEGFAVSCAPAAAPAAPQVTAIPIDLAAPTVGAAPATTIVETPVTVATPASATASEIEERWGIRITFVAVTAGGGLIDVRFKVIDPRKAQPIVDDPRNLPILVSEGGVTITRPSTIINARADLKPGQTYFLLYGNPQGAVRSSSPVSVIIGGLRLDNVIAR